MRTTTTSRLWITRQRAAYFERCSDLTTDCRTIHYFYNSVTKALTNQVNCPVSASSATYKVKTLAVSKLYTVHLF